MVQLEAASVTRLKTPDVPRGLPNAWPGVNEESRPRISAFAEATADAPKPSAEAGRLIAAWRPCVRGLALTQAIGDAHRQS